MSVMVPGVITRTTSRLTSFRPLAGASICSQTATFWPARMSRATYPSAAWCGMPAMGMAPSPFCREVSVIWSRRDATWASSKNSS